MKPSLRSRLEPLLPLAVVLALYGRVSETFAFPAALLASAGLAALVGPRLPVDRATQRVFAVVCGVLAVSVTRASIDVEQGRLLHPFWVGLITAVSVIVGFRALCRVPDGGPRATIAFEVVALIAVGERRVGPMYPVAVVLFLAAAIYVLRAADTGRLPLSAVSSRSRHVATAIAVSTLPIAVLFVAPARPLANFMHRKIELAFDRAYESRASTFGDAMRVGKLSRMLRSDTVVLRIYGPDRGPKPELLRAVVFDTYSDGLFSHAAPSDSGEVVETRRGPLLGADVAYAMRGGRETDRFFLPLGATDVATGTGQLRIEPAGILRGSSPEATKRFWFRMPHGDASVETETTPADLAIPEAMRGPLTGLAAQWTAGATDDAAILEQIESHLRNEFTYALDRDHSKGADPILHFLYRDRAGHCEYFAAAMTLLARAKGIPARYVAGYRVSERNMIDGHSVIREKNAHSWVEARVGARGWKSFDPTPMAEQLGPSNAQAGVDFIASIWERTSAWIVDRSLAELTIAAAFGTLLFALVRWWRNRHPATQDVGAGLQTVAGPLPFLADLLSALKDAGFSRPIHTPLERFARELPDATAAALILRYSAHRYGAVADADLPKAMAQHAAELRARSRTGDGLSVFPKNE